MSEGIEIHGGMDLDSLGLAAWLIAEESGWHATLTYPISIERVMTNLVLIHSEVSEAVEAVRKDPDHLGEELADVIIRVVELAHTLGITLDSRVVEKMRKNRERLDVPARGGGKVV